MFQSVFRFEHKNQMAPVSMTQKVISWHYLNPVAEILSTVKSVLKSPFNNMELVFLSAAVDCATSISYYARGVSSIILPRPYKTCTFSVLLNMCTRRTL